MPDQEVQLSIVPILAETGSLADSALTIMYSDSANRYSLYPIEDVHKVIEKDPQLVSVLDKIIVKDYSSEELQSNPKLQYFISDGDLKYIRDKLGNSDLLLLPIYFQVANKLNHTFGEAWFRLYDLNSGELVYHVADNFNVNLGGQQGKRRITLFLIANSYSYFTENIVDKL